MTTDLLVCAATELEGSLLRGHAELLLTGIGQVNAAHSLTRYLDRHDVRRIVVCGIGGAYLGSGLAIGDVVCADTECFGDLGVATPEGFLDMNAIGFGAGFDPLSMQLFPVDQRGRFVTVNTCTGIDALSRDVEQRTGGAVENMEGAALAHVAVLAGVEIGEVRGISNRTGNRDRASWRVKEAAEAAQQALIKWIKTL